MRTTKTVHLFNYETEEQETFEVPAKWEICDACRGNGKSSAYLGAFTQDDVDELGPEWLEDYIDGAYDRICEACEGDGKVLVVDPCQCDPKIYGRIQEEAQADWEYEQLREMERRMGC